MRKKFIIMLHEVTSEQEKAFGKLLTENGLYWWHWLSNAWLAIDDEGGKQVGQIRDFVNQAFGDTRNLVIEMPEGSGTWAGRGPTTEDKDMFAWIRKNWT